MRYLSSVLLVATIFTWQAASAQGPMASLGVRFPISGSDTQELVYFGVSKPTLIRLHLHVGGRPYTAPWHDYIRSLFHFLDRDGNGWLSKDEAERAPRAQNLRALLGGNFFNAGPGTTASFSQLDNNPRDGKVTLEELAHYYDRFGLSALQVSFTRVYGPGDNPLTEALFKHLDANDDNKLSREEVQNAPALLARLDLNEDESINPEELVPGFGAANPLQFQMMAAPDNSFASLPRDAPFALFTPGESARRVVGQLLDHYDKNKDRKLSPAECGFDLAVFARVDRNQDGFLDADELARWLAGSADLEFRIELGKGGSQPAITAVHGAREDVNVPAIASRMTDDGMIVLTLPDAQIELVCLRGQNSGFDATRAQVLEQFKNADPDKKGYLTKKDADLSGIFGPLFRVLDRDGDGKVTRQELDAFLEVHAKAAASSTVLALADHGRMLFDVLDANRDGRLGIRELRAAWTRVAAWDRKQTGSISREDIPRRYQLTFSQGQPNARNPREPIAMTPTTQPGKPSAKGPLWFRKMDRNGDGDVSPREFLGSPEDFKKIDTDGDGLIDAQEAERADGWFRKQISTPTGKR
jgi:Ca2+-binding EF-hand superfamily protein